MHGQKETSYNPRIVCTVAHLAFLAAAAWIYFGDGVARVPGWFGVESVASGDPVRHMILFSLGVVLLVRMTIGLFYLLRRKFGWDELAGVVFALFVYQIGFALLGASKTRPVGAIDILAVLLFLFGSYLNTGSELQRKRFKDDPSNEGRLYTGGLFRHVRHVNYFGDILWVTAWATITWNPWSLLVPAALTAGFVFVFIPALTEHLRNRYGDQFEEWAARSRALVPFLY